MIIGERNKARAVKIFDVVNGVGNVVGPVHDCGVQRLLHFSRFNRLSYVPT